MVFQIPQAPAPAPVQYPYHYGQGQFLPPYYTPYPPQQHSGGERSSPIYDDPEEVMSEFFNIWLVARRGWSLKDKDLFPKYRDEMAERGYYIDDLRDESGITMESWVSWGFKEGHLRRLRSDSRAFKIERRC
jgi:hypothetical protein